MKLGIKQKEYLAKAYATSRKGLAAATRDRRVACERLCELGFMRQDGDGSYSYHLTEAGIVRAAQIVEAD